MLQTQAYWETEGWNGAIHRAAGRELLEECWTLHGCRIGEAKITGAYKLLCRYVIHTAGPIWRDGNHGREGLLADCYRNSLRVAVENGIRTIAFLSISTGVYHFPVQLAAQIAIRTAWEFLEGHPDKIDVVMWGLFDEHMEACYRKEVERYR